jgi:hypothetical protein
MSKNATAEQDMKRCYDCRDVVTKDYYMWEILSEDGGEPVYPERGER